MLFFLVSSQSIVIFMDFVAILPYVFYPVFSPSSSSSSSFYLCFILTRYIIYEFCCNSFMGFNHILFYHHCNHKSRSSFLTSVLYDFPSDLAAILLQFLSFFFRIVINCIIISLDHRSSSFFILSTHYAFCSV